MTSLEAWNYAQERQNTCKGFLKMYPYVVENVHKYT